MKKFAFLVHPRVSAREDMKKVFWPLGLVPNNLLEWVIKYLPPIPYGRVTYYPNEEIAGWIIGVHLTGSQIYSLSRKFVLNRIVQAIQKAKNLGAKIVGLGELISSITHGGKDLVGKVNGIGITNGNALTAFLTVAALKKAAFTKGIDLRQARVAVIGATGSSGSAISLLLAEEGISLILVARGRIKLENLKKQIAASFPRLEVVITTSIEDVREAEVVIVTTSSVEQIIKAEHLKEGALVYDLTQPRNTSPFLLRQREDITIIDGGIVATPGVNYGLDIGLKKDQAYACLAETMILAMEGRNGNYVGTPTPEQAKEMFKLMKKYEHLFHLAPFHSFGVPLDQKG